jgi:transcriptional regulator with XRE-family HTH domain
MITGKHIRAARGWLNWTQKDLSEKSGVSAPTIVRFELGEGEPFSSTAAKIEKTFLLAEIECREDGIREKPMTVFLYDFLDVLEDAANTLMPGEEIYFHCADSRRSSSEVIEKLNEMEKYGIILRFTFERGNSYFTTSPDNYRWIDPALFANSQVQIAYADRYIEDIPAEQPTFIMIRNPDYALSKKRQLKFFWKNGEIPQ